MELNGQPCKPAMSIYCCDEAICEGDSAGIARGRGKIYSIQANRRNWRDADVKKEQKERKEGKAEKGLQGEKSGGDAELWRKR